MNPRSFLADRPKYHSHLNYKLSIFSCQFICDLFDLLFSIFKCLVFMIQSLTLLRAEELHKKVIESLYLNQQQERFQSEQINNNNRKLKESKASICSSVSFNSNPFTMRNFIAQGEEGTNWPHILVSIRLA